MAERPPFAVIIGVGARTIGGLTAQQVTMSARSGRFLLRESHLIDRHGEPMTVARLPSIGDQSAGLPRFVALGAPALLQALFPWREWVSRQGMTESPLPVVIALPEADRPGLDPLLATHLLPALGARARIVFDSDRSSLVSGGSAAGALALEQALSLLAAGEEAVLVGGIDSQLHPDFLDHLDEERRLHGLDTENGFIPGEGAAFLLLATARAAGAFVPLGRVVSVAHEEEPHPYGSDEPCLGVGLTRAVRAAVTAAKSEGALGWVLTDVSNERHRVDEWTCAFGRNHQAFCADVVHDQPLLKTGSLGAAAIPALLAMAAVRWQTGCAVAPRALVATASDGPLRGAVVARRGDER